jgi:hypothetical protein
MRTKAVEETTGREDEGAASRQQDPAGPAGAFLAGPPQQEWAAPGAAAGHSGAAKEARNTRAVARPNAFRIMTTL